MALQEMVICLKAGQLIVMEQMMVMDGQVGVVLGITQVANMVLLIVNLYYMLDGKL